MPATAIDPKTALIVIDLQKGLAAMVPPAVFEPVVERSHALAAAFRKRGLPVVLVTADAVAPGRTEAPRRTLAGLPPEFFEVVAALDPHPDDIRIVKQTWCTNRNTDLEAQLSALGVTQLVVTGVATSAGVESTARQAYEAGFNVAIDPDAIADLNPAAHDASLANIFPRLGETGATDDILALLGAQAGA